MADPKEKEKAPEQFFMVIVYKDAREPEVLSMASEEELTKAISDHVLKAEPELFYTYVFYGTRYFVESPKPMCRVKIGDRNIDVMGQSSGVSASGLIRPLRPISEAKED